MLKFLLPEKKISTSVCTDKFMLLINDFSLLGVGRGWSPGCGLSVPRWGRMDYVVQLQPIQE